MTAAKLVANPAEGHGLTQRVTDPLFHSLARIEPVSDAHDAEQVRHLIQVAWDKRHTVQTLPMDWPGRSDEEQRRFLFSLIDEWAGEEGKTPGEVAETWRDHFGIDVDATDTPAGYAPADYRKADAHRLREFCLSVGVLADDDVAGSDEDDEAAASG